MTLETNSRRARDGSLLWWGGADTPGPPQVVAPGAPTSVLVAVAPVLPGHAVTVEYRVNRGPVREAIGLPEPRTYNVNANIFRAVLPGLSGGLVEFLPVLRFVGTPISSRLGESVECSSYRAGRATEPVEVPELHVTSKGAVAGQPRWAWGTKFLGSVRIRCRKEGVGVAPDGLRIEWYFEEGSLTGPSLNGILVPGAADWMRIRRDGVAIIDVQACLETQGGARIYAAWGGILDLGPNGYDRALHGEFERIPPFVNTPTFVTADKQMAWLNRAQCIGVGRVDTMTLRVEFDLYVVQVGEHKYAR